MKYLKAVIIFLSLFTLSCQLPAMDNPEGESESSESLDELLQETLLQMEKDEKHTQKEQYKREGVSYGLPAKKLSSEQIIQNTLKAMKNVPKEGALKKLREKLNSNNAYSDLRLLTNNGRNVDARDKDGSTALMKATGKKDYELMRLLLDAGAFVDATDNAGQTALMRANGNAGSVDILLKAGADVNAADNYDQTPLMSAMQNVDAYYVVRDLINAGADVNAKDRSGRNALMRAVSSFFHNDSGIVRLLLAAGTNVNEKNARGETALMDAVTHDYRGIFPSDKIELLINAGANVNDQNNYGQTALMFASQRRNERVVKLLLDNGAKRSLVDDRGHTANDYALEKDYKQLEIERLLKR